MPPDKTVASYDPHVAPNPWAWLAMDEAARIDLVSKYHADACPNVPRSNRKMHATMHAVVENHLAKEIPEVRDTLARLMSEGLDRHDAIHAISSVLTWLLWQSESSRGEDPTEFSMENYLKELGELTAQAWLSRASEKDRGPLETLPANPDPATYADETRRIAAEQYADSSNLAARILLHQYSTSPRRWPAWLFDQLGIPMRASLLEIGCGTGAFWAANMNRIPAGWDLTVSDYSGGMIAEACRSLAQLRRPMRFLRCNAEALPFPAGTFDAVLAFHMLYHVPDRERALSEVRRVLRPGGRLYAATNGERHLKELHELLHRFVPEVETSPDQMVIPFSLENGAAQLDPIFASVEKRVHDDALAVDAPEAIIGYYLSLPGNAREVLRGARLDALRRDLREELVRQGGAIVIGKESGLFIATTAAEE